MIELTILEFWITLCSILVIMGLINSLLNYLEPLPYDFVDTYFFKIAANFFGFFFPVFIILTPIILILYFWLLPNIYIVEDCNKYEKKILINPFLKINKTDFDFGNNCYVINNSNKVLYTDVAIYGSTLFNQEMNNIIQPNTIQKFSVSKFDDIFKKSPNIIKIKSHGSSRYYLGCEKTSK